MKYAIALAAIVLLVGCGTGVDGTYADKNGMASYTFKSNGTVVQSIMGTEVELKYEVDGNKIKIGSPQGAVVFTLLDNGAIKGPMGLELTKQQKQ